MKVAIYLDSHAAEHKVLAKRCIESVRAAMPQAEIWHLTDENGPEIEGVDNTLRVQVEGTFCYRRCYIQSLVLGDTLFIDTDVEVKEDVSHVFNDDFDVAVTTDMHPGTKGIIYNSGVTFSRSPRFWSELSERLGEFEFPDWHVSEREFSAYASSCSLKIKVLPGEEYNYVPAADGDFGGKIIHFRGLRKRWRLGIHKIGVDTKFVSVLNTDVGQMLEQARENLKRDLPKFKVSEPHERAAVIVGGGPSLVDSLDDLRAQKDSGADIYALNGVHDFLLDQGIKPDFHVLLDSRPANISFVQNPQKGIKYLVAAQCHPDIFDALKGYDVVQWVAWIPGADVLAQEFDPQMLFVGGGNTVGLKALTLCAFSGYRDISLFGYDSSYREGENHAYKQPLNDGESTMEVMVGMRVFHCARWMARQAYLFQHHLKELSAMGVNVSVYGDGLIPWMVHQYIIKAQRAA